MVLVLLSRSPVASLDTRYGQFYCYSCLLAMQKSLFALRNVTPVVGEISAKRLDDEDDVDVCIFKDDMDLKSLLDDLISRRGRPSSMKCSSESVKRCIVSLQPELKIVRRFRNNMAHLLNNPLEETKRLLTALHRVRATLAKELGESAAFASQSARAHHGEQMLMREDLEYKPFNSLHRHMQVKVCLSKSVATSDKARLSDALPQLLIGRNKVLHDLAEMFTASKTNKSIPSDPLRVLIHGPPGVGKTALVQALAYKLRSVFPRQYKFNAANTTALSTDIETFLKNEHLGNDEPADVKTKMNLLMSNLNVLLIFEDVSDPNSVWPLISSTKLCAIFTSSNDHLWLESNIRPCAVQDVPLRPLETKASILLVKTIVKRVAERPVFNELFKHGGCLQRKTSS